MAVFKIGEPVKTEEAFVDVESTADAPLLPGSYVFELVVVDDAGNQSPPARATVTITDPGPSAIIQAPKSVPSGKKFRLDGSKSSDVPPGHITTYIWTLTQPG